MEQISTALDNLKPLTLTVAARWNRYRATMHLTKKRGYNY